MPDAAPSGTDLRVARLLRSAKVGYDLLPDGTYLVHAELPSGGHRTLYVNSKTHWLGRQELRVLVTCASNRPKPLPSGLAESLLTANALSTFEKWELLDAGDSWAVLLSKWVPADADVSEFLTAAHTLAEAADLSGAVELTEEGL